MATCLTTISEVDQLIELSSGVTHRIEIDQNKNSLFSLSNELDQSVFFNVRFIGAYSAFSVSLTIYNQNTLRVFGTLNLNQQSVNTSFTIVSGEYYVCIRPISGSYTLDFSTTYISYNKVATFNVKSYFGFYSESNLEIKKGNINYCNRRLIYTVADGKLPDGLEMADNGLITGYLPMLDCDPENYDLPPSSSWYHQLSDSEYVTPWGRAYRFQVHLTLWDDPTKVDLRWFYILIINDFSKNIALVDKYEILEDDRIATFEEKIKLANISLCPIPEETVLSKSSSASNLVVLDPLITDFENVNNNGNLNNDTSNQDGIWDSNSEENNLYLKVENAQVDDPDADLIYEVDTGYINYMTNHTEMFALNSENVRNNQFYYRGKGLAEYFIENFDDEDDLLIIQLRDSYMMNQYLYENNFDSKYINYEVLDRFFYEKIRVEIVKLEGIDYLQFTNETEDETTLNDAAKRLEEMQQRNYSKLPWSPYSWIGFTSEFKLF